MIKVLLAFGLVLLGISTGLRAEDDAAKIAELAATYPLKTCVISGAQLGSMGDPVDVLHEGRLVRFCCKGCIKKFKAESEKFLKQIDEAAAKGGDGKAAAEAAPKDGGAKQGGCGGCGKQTGCGGCAGVEKAPAPAAGEAVPKASGSKGGCGSGCGGCGR
jgi:hypothetical protein